MSASGKDYHAMPPDELAAASPEMYQMGKTDYAFQDAWYGDPDTLPRYQAINNLYLTSAKENTLEAAAYVAGFKRKPQPMESIGAYGLECPRCVTVLNHTNKPDYCQRCGQPLDWWGVESQNDGDSGNPEHRRVGTTNGRV